MNSPYSEHIFFVSIFNPPLAAAYADTVSRPSSDIIEQILMILPCPFLIMEGMTATPANRWLQPDELGGPAVFLASDASNGVNGHILYVDGGILAYIESDLRAGKPPLDQRFRQRLCVLCIIQHNNRNNT